MKPLFKAVIFSLLIISSGLHAEEVTKPNDADALKGVTTGKAIFDINMESAKKMTLYLMVIKETVEDLKRQNVDPDIVLAFRGKSVSLIAKDREEMELTDYEHLDKIAEQIKELQDAGVRVEACSIATRLSNIDNNELLDGVKPVGNTFVSLTGYQAQGYANIPIY